MASSADIGIRVFLDDAASAGLYDLNMLLNQMGMNAMNASQGFMGLTGAMAGLAVVAGFGVAFALFTDAIKYSVQAASNLQQALFAVAVATHVPMSVAMQYANTLMNLAASSTYTSADIATGIVQLGRAGYSISQIFDQIAQSGAGFVDVGGKMVPIMSSMAEAGIALGIAIRGTAEQGFLILAQAMAAYHAPADQALEIANLLQFAFEHQRGSISDFAAGLGQITPEAATFHVSLQDVVAALDTVGPAMSSTERAGTALRYMLAGIYSPTAAGQKEMIALGLASVDASGQFHSAFFNAQGQAVDFTTAVELLAKKLATLPQQQQIQALHNLFSIRGGQGADILLQNVQKYLGYLDQLKTSQNNANGAMSRWQQVMQTIAGAQAGLSSSITDLAAAIGLSMAPAVVAVLTGLNHFITAIRNVMMVTPQSGATFLLVGAVLSGLGVIIGPIILAINGIGTALLLMSVIIIGTVIAIAAISLGITLLLNHFGGLQGTIHAVLSTLNALRPVFMALVVIGAVALAVWLTPMAASLITLIALLPVMGSLMAYLGVVALAQGAAWVINNAGMLAASVLMKVQLIPSLLATAGAWLLNAVMMTLAALPYILLAAVIAGAIVGLVLLIQHLGGLNFLLQAGRAIWAQLLPVLQSVGNEIRSAFLQALRQLQPVWQQLVTAFNAARPVLMFLGMLLGGLIATAIALLIGLLLGAVRAVGALVVAFIHVAAGVIQAFAGVIQFFLGFFTLLHGLFTRNNTEVTQGWNAMGQGILNIARGLWAAVSGVFVGAFNVIKGFVSGFINGVLAFFHGLSQALVGHSIIPDMLNAILGVFRAILSAILSFVVGWIAQAISSFVRLGSMLVQVITNAINFVRAVFSAGFAAVISFFAGAASAIAGTAARIISILISAAQSAVGGFRNGFWSGITNILSLIGSVPGQILGALAGLGGMLFNSGINAMEMFAGGLRSALGSVVSAISNAAGQVADFLGHFSPAKMGPLAHDDQWMPNMMHMMAQGIEDNTPLLTNALQKATSGMAAVPQMSRTAGAATLAAATVGAAGPAHTTQTINLTVDGKTLSQVVLNNVNGQMQMNGLGRAFR